MIPRRPLTASFALLTLGFFASAGFSSLGAQVSNVGPNESANASSLPNGLLAVSQLAVGGSRLALDSNGTLFRSDDQGRHWHPVKQQWEGKAVELLGIPALTSAPGSGQAPRAQTVQETYVAVLLKSTAALHWVSVDRGKTWTPSTLDDVRRNDVHWSGQ
ncbi:MAG: hypothetical protein WA510_08530 [Acidobacteriaceae bacterium]